MSWLLSLLVLDPAFAADTWKVKGTESSVYAVLRLNDTEIANTTGSLDHAIRLGLMEGTVTIDGDTVTGADVKGVVASIKPADAALRKAAKLSGVISEDQAGRLLDCVFNQLQPEKTNEITFLAKSATGTLAELQVTGDLTIHAVTQEVTVPLAIVAEGETMRATGTLPINVPDFGFRIPESGWSVKDDASIVLDIVLGK